MTLNERAWNDIKNGVNPYSKSTVFHVSFDEKLAGKTLTPRIPNWITKLKKDGVNVDDMMKDNHRAENYDIPRVCFSPSVEGSLSSIINNPEQVIGKQLYVYIPEKPLSEYKTKANRAITKDRDVFDSHLTKEMWILEPVKLKFYGTIVVDTISLRAKEYYVTGKNHSKDEKDKIGKLDFKWHWVMHPSITKYGKSVMESNSEELSLTGFESRFYNEDTEQKIDTELRPHHGFTMEEPFSIAEEAFNEYMKSIEVANPVLENTAFFTPIELNNLHVGVEEEFEYSPTPDKTTLESGLLISSWRENYINGFYTGISENFQADWNNTMRKLYSDFDIIKESGDVEKINARKQTILNLGWNPEIDFNEKNQIFAKNRLFNAASNFQDINVEYQRIYEKQSEEGTNSILDERFAPVYIVVTKNDNDNKCSIMVDYTDASLMNLNCVCPQTSCAELTDNDNVDVFMTLVSLTTLDKIRRNIESEISMPQVFFYSNPFMQCSYIMKNLTNNNAVNHMTNQRKIFHIYSGPISSYSPEAAHKATRYAIRMHEDEIDVIESRAFNEALEIDKDGNMLIYRAKSRVLDYGSEINKCAKLCKIYTSSSDIEGLKYEVAKAYYINLLIEEDMGNLPKDTPDIERNKLINNRRTCWNIFTQNMKYITKQDSEFNFVEYYNKSIFAGAISITNSTFKYTIQAMINMLKAKF